MITKGNKWVKCGLQRVKLPNDYVKVEKKRKELLKRFSDNAQMCILQTRV